MKPQVKPVVTPSDMKKFLRLPWEIYKNDKCWVPPLISDVRHPWIRWRNPALENSSVAFPRLKDGNRSAVSTPDRPQLNPEKT